MKGLSVLAFFLVFTIAIGLGLVMVVAGNGLGWVVLGGSLLVYGALFAWAGCLTTSH